MLDTDRYTGGRKLTPMLEQYVQAKAQCPDDSILMFRMGDFFELFFKDAEVAARELDLVLTARDKGSDAIPMAGVPHHAVTGYVSKLVERGFSVAICDQVEDPKQAKGLVRREITRLITPGTVSDSEGLDPSALCYLAAVAPLGESQPQQVGVVLLDLLAGQLLWTEVARENLVDECLRFGVREVLVPSTWLPDFRDPHGDWAIPAHSLSSDQAFASEEELERRFGDRGHVIAQNPLAPLMLELIAFAENTQRQPLMHIQAPRRFDLSGHLVLDEATRRNLELVVTSQEGRREGSLYWTLNRCKTAMGSRLLMQRMLFPERDLAEIETRLSDVEILKSDRPLRRQIRKALEWVRDIERLVGRITVGRANPRDLGALRQSLKVMPEVSEIAQALTTSLGHKWRSADLCSELLELLVSALVDEPPTSDTDGGIFRLGYQPALDTLIKASTDGHAFLADLEERERQATGIQKLKVRYNKVFGYYIEVSKANLSLVPEHYVRKQTLVNAERYITPELKDFETTVLNADFNRKVREQELFGELLQAHIERVDALRALADLIAETDVAATLADLADEYRYVRPSFVTERRLRLEGSRHPVVERLLPGGERFIANDIELDADSRRLMMITGPNMGGKSTVMRQVALSVLMAQMGSFVPAKVCELAVFDRIFTRVGASDDLGRGRSTFMVEMSETATILKDSTAHSLVILDEVGRGTSTFDGVSIAWSVAEYLHDQARPLTMFATHYHELTDLAAHRDGVVNACVSVKQRDGGIVFLRKLKDGAASKSYGVHVAALAGLPRPVLERAFSLLERLESDTKERHGLSKRKVSRNQLSLFGQSVAQPESSAQPEARAPSEAEEALRSLKIDALTPLQALVELDRLRRLVEEEGAAE